MQTPVHFLVFRSLAFAQRRVNVVFLFIQAARRDSESTCQVTIGVLGEVPAPLLPTRARVELYVFEGGGSKTVEAWLSSISTFEDDLDVENTVKVDFTAIRWSRVW